MKLSKSKFEQIYLFSTNTKLCLASTLPNSCKGVVIDTFLYSLIATFEIGSVNLTLFLISLVVNMVDVNIPKIYPSAFLTGN